MAAHFVICTYDYTACRRNTSCFGTSCYYSDRITFADNLIKGEGTYQILTCAFAVTEQKILGRSFFVTKGIDVSVHQREIDWKKVKADSVDFAILRAGYGRELSQKDTQF